MFSLCLPKFAVILVLFAQVLDPAPPDQIDGSADAPQTQGEGKAESSKAPQDGEATQEQDEKSKQAEETSAAEAEPAVETMPESFLGQVYEALDTGLLHYMFAGGLFMWILLAMGIVALGVSIERIRTLQMLKTDSDSLKQEVLELLNSDQIEAAIEKCDRADGPVPAILATGLRRFLVLKRLNYDAGRIEEQVIKAMDDYGVHITAALEKHLPILATVSSVAPMLGFLGTVQGMIIAFAEIVAKFGEINIVLAAADGLQVSLLTTVMGLLIGIPSFIAFNYFTGVINRFVLEVESSAAQLIEAVTLQMALRQPSAAETNGAAVTHEVPVEQQT